MALLKIIKLSNKTWKHNSDVDGNFILTKFYAKQEDNEFLLVETYGSKRRKYLISEIEVYDIGGSAELFTNFDDLFLRLEALKYPAFYIDGEVDLSTKVDKVSTSGVERAYIINADGSQGTKATSDFKDVLEFADFDAFPTTGETGKIYVALDKNKTYRWSGSVYVQIGGGIKGFHRFQSPNFSPAANTTYYIGGNNLGLLGSPQTSNLHARVKAMVTGKIGKVSFFASAGLSTSVGANVYLDNITKGTSLQIASNFIWTTNGAVNFISNSDFLVDIGDSLTIRLKIGGDGTGGGGGTNNNFWAELTIE